MEWWALIQALVLGVVEGITEFLPVSSTGHLIIAADIIGFTGERAKTFEIFIQLGSILGVMWHFRAKITDVIGHLNTVPAQKFALNIAVAFLPAALLGVAVHGAIKQYLFNPFTVAIALIAGGIAILVIERRPRVARVTSLEAMSVKTAFLVGCAQTLALFPGVSRSGATIMGGLLAGLGRTTATEFSFFLAMPTMLAATVYDLYKTWHLLSAADLPVFALGFITAFITALIVVRLFLNFVTHHTFTPFAYYRIGFGCAVLIYFW